MQAGKDRAGTPKSAIKQKGLIHLSLDSWLRIPSLEARWKATLNSQDFSDLLSCAEANAPTHVHTQTTYRKERKGKRKEKTAYYLPFLELWESVWKSRGE